MAVRSITCPQCGTPMDRVGKIATCAGCGYAGILNPLRVKGHRPKPDKPRPAQASTGPGPAVGRETLGGNVGLRPPEGPDEIGRLSHYRVLELIGAGGMGAVYKAEDLHLQRLVALKVLLPGLMANPMARERFLREARAAARVEHDHIVPVHQIGEDHGTAFLAMPLLKGETLADHLAGGSPIPAAEVARIGKEVAEGLAAAHQQGLIHRDIKPANVWLEGRRRRVKILDFGLARLANAGAGDDSGPAAGKPTAGAALTQAGAIIGTPAYMSPEQARGEPLDVRSDLFSLGTLLYQMATGAMPFQGRTTMAVLAAVAGHVPPQPAEINPDLPPAVNDLIVSLLAKRPADRPASAADVARRLTDVEVGLTAVPLAEGPVSSARNRAAELFAGLTDAGPDSESGRMARHPNMAPLARSGGGRRRLILGVAVGVGLLVGVGLAVRAVMLGGPPTGILVIDRDDPTVEVVIRKDGAIVRDRTRAREVELVAGTYSVEPADQRNRVRLTPDQVTVAKGSRVEVKVRAERPKPAEPKVVVSPPTPPADAATHVPEMPATKAPDAGPRIVPVNPVLEVAPEYRKAAEWVIATGNGSAVEITSPFGGRPTLVTDPFELRGPFTVAAVRLQRATPGLLDQLPAALRPLGTIPLLRLHGTDWTDKNVARALAGLDGVTVRRVECTGLPGPLGDALTPLAKLRGLRYVLGPVNPAVGLKPLSVAADLDILAIGGPRTTDATLAGAADLPPSLRSLSLNGSPITDAGLTRLEKCRQLTLVTLKQTKVTEKGVKSLAVRLPKCWIDWDGGTIEPAPTGDFALRFDRDAYVMVPEFTMDLSAAFTIEVWATPEARPEAGSTVLGHETGPALEVHTFRLPEPTWRYTWRAPDLIGSASVIVGQRIHLAVVQDGVKVRLYLDGHLMDTRDDARLAVGTARFPLAIGAGFVGVLDEARVSKGARYDKDFTPARRFDPDPDTLGLWHFDEGDGTILKDSSGRGCHGLITGATWVTSDGRPVGPKR